MSTRHDNIAYMAATLERRVTVIPPNETSAAKLYRLASAQFREFVKEYPDEAVRIVRELVPSVVK